MWIDSHCHLNHPKIEEAGTPDEIIARAKEAGVEGMLTICCRVRKEFDEVFAIANEHDNVWMSVGTHPHDAADEDEKTVTADELISLADSYDKIVGIGEAGLDYYYDNSPREDQQQDFRKHIHVAKETGLPLIIHTREAEDDTINILREEGACDGKTKVLMHCFSSNETLARQSIDEGFMMSFSGIVTFSKATELQEIVKMTPVEQLLVETDAPYLAPVPYRGKTNEPAFVIYTGQFIAELKKLHEEEVAKHSKQNFFRLFDKALKTYKEPDNG